VPLFSGLAPYANDDGNFALVVPLASRLTGVPEDGPEVARCAGGHKDMPDEVSVSDPFCDKEQDSSLLMSVFVVDLISGVPARDIWRSAFDFERSGF
jgi:hypothetical protein